MLNDETQANGELILKFLDFILQKKIDKLNTDQVSQIKTKII